MAKANTQLEEREAKYKADAEAKSKIERGALVKDHREKLKVQQDHFTQKQKELKAEIDGLKRQLKEAEAAK